MTERITKDDVLELLREVVDEEGEYFVYTPLPGRAIDMATCDYVREGQYSCIAARVFGKLGVPVSELSVREGRAAYSVAKELGLPMTRQAKNTLSTAQEAQDRGVTWGEALNEAKAAQ